jgi:16S rRNA (uracil1498-N3)-methyltransferase
MSRPPQFFISPENVSASQIVITGEDVRHIATVLRMKAGDELLLCDGQGTDYAVKIVHADRSLVKTEITNQSKREIRSPRITLGQGLPKSDKMDFIVQKATELGVADIVPIITERTIVKIRDEEKRIARWQKIAREAAMQSGRPDIPSIGHIVSYTDFLSSLVAHPSTLKLLPWEEETRPIKTALREKQDVKSIVVLIGPEGGFSKAEAELAKDRDVHLVSLGPNVLRTETAAIAVLGMIGYEFWAF